jgi:hypothetical protein
MANDRVVKKNCVSGNRYLEDGQGDKKLDGIAKYKKIEEL